MSEYGVSNSGYIRKPVSIILSEIEAAMIEVFGPGVIQTAQSPLGQLNGMIADLVAELDERHLDLYQSYDPDQAEGTRLDILGRIRLLDRGAADDTEYRIAITNEDQARIDMQDMHHAIMAVDGVTWAQVYVNDSSSQDSDGIPANSISAAVIGGIDQDVADAIRAYVVPGVGTYGNTSVSTNVGGYARVIDFIRPVNVSITLTVSVIASEDPFGCPPPSQDGIKSMLVDTWNANPQNGLDVNAYNVRKIIEGAYTNVQVTDVVPTTTIGFMQLGIMTQTLTTVVIN